MTVLCDGVRVSSGLLIKNNWKAAGRRVKRSEIWDSFDLIVLIAILEASPYDMGL